MDVIDRWARSISSGEFDLSLLAANARIWHSHDRTSITVEEERALIEAARQSFTDIRATAVTVRRHDAGAILEYTIELKANDGVIQRVPAMASVTIDDDRITRVDEYILNESVRNRDQSEWVVGVRPVADAHDRLMADIIRLQLERHVVELEIYGYTVLPPEVVGQADILARLRATVLRIAEERTGLPARLDGGEAYGDRQAPLGRGFFLSNTLFEDRVFEEALMNEPALTLITYLLGDVCILNQQSLMVKGAGGAGLSLHADHMGSPEPFPHVAQFANATWVLTDYSKENGCTAVVPGSHHLCRQPTKAENDDQSMWHPVEAAAGSIIIWHGNLWHAAFPRSAPGLRVSLSNFFCRWGVSPQDQVRGRVTQEMLERNPPRFAVLAGLGHPALRRPDGLNNPYRHSPFDSNRFSVKRMESL